MSDSQTRFNTWDELKDADTTSCWTTHNDSTIIHGDVLTIERKLEDSIDLVVTSPPYNVDLDYNSHNDGDDYGKYLVWTEQWLERCFAWMKDDGRLCLNIPLDKNKGGQQSVGADITNIAKNIGFQYHSTIVWNEGNISRRTAWGSWMSASAPYVIAPVELVLVLFKNVWKKQKRGESDITREEFMSWTNGVWVFNGEKKTKIGHPAPFPVELPLRCIKLFSFVGDIVMDPFLGSGSTLIAAIGNDRTGIGIEIDKEYCELAKSRIQSMNFDVLDPLRQQKTNQYSHA